MVLFCKHCALKRSAWIKPVYKLLKLVNINIEIFFTHVNFVDTLLG